MAAAAFVPGTRSAVNTHQGLDPTTLAVTLGIASAAFMLAVLLISAYEEWRASRLEPRVEELGRAVEHASAEIRDLSGRLVELQDAERRRLATELHDIVGQNLSALVTELALIRSHFPAEAEPELHRNLADATLLAKQSVRAVREVMAQLRPPGLGEFGLPATLRWHARAFESRTGVETTVSADESLSKPSAAVEDALVRICLEALTNVSKHAAAHTVLIELGVDNERIRLRVADDGSGFRAQAPLHDETVHWGLAIMQARAAAVGGQLRVHSAPGEGTVVEFAISQVKWS
jgi:signal transduction histidine kinase